MIQWFNKMLRWASFWRYALKVSVLYVMGRWYVFRDTPTWFVEDMVRACTKAKPLRIKTDYPNFLQQAQDELALRKRRNA